LGLVRYAMALLNGREWYVLIRGKQKETNKNK
jgi:hypothetical protein